ncbi:MAG: hypothetical protein H6606_05300 [Flavobacteriales bacterium]|nr:hypothetical protein [Flavobacteriales bacterium]
MEYIQPIIDFFNHPIFIVVGGFTVLVAIIGLIYRTTSMIFGLTPLIFRVGKALWRRKIAIIANSEAYSSLNETLSDSGIFKRKNIIHITPDNIDKIKTYSIILADWESCNDSIEQIFAARKSDKTAVIISAKAGAIPRETMPQIANKSNTVVVNFKGRLLNDILNSLITTSFDE